MSQREDSDKTVVVASSSNLPELHVKTEAPDQQNQKNMEDIYKISETD